MMSTELPKTIFILQSFDEMRHPYETALLAIPVKVRWFSALNVLVEAAASETPQLVIVDLDGFSSSVETALSQIKGAFSASDLIALSSSDSAQMALQCLRSGFSDYLLKPTSPEELAWSIRKRLQNHELFRRFDEGKVDVIRAITQISNCTAASLVRIFALEYVTRILGSEGAAWVTLSGTSPVVQCALPKDVNPQRNFRVGYSGAGTAVQAINVGTFD
jgi:CheY-like chemotaxis protein